MEDSQEAATCHSVLVLSAGAWSSLFMNVEPRNTRYVTFATKPPVPVGTSKSTCIRKSFPLHGHRCVYTILGNGLFTSAGFDQSLKTQAVHSESLTRVRCHVGFGDSRQTLGKFSLRAKNPEAKIPPSALGLTRNVFYGVGAI